MCSHNEAVQGVRAHKYHMQLALQSAAAHTSHLEVLQAHIQDAKDEVPRGQSWRRGEQAAAAG